MITNKSNDGPNNRLDDDTRSRRLAQRVLGLHNGRRVTRFYRHRVHIRIIYDLYLATVVNGDHRGVFIRR